MSIHRGSGRTRGPRRRSLRCRGGVAATLAIALIVAACGPADEEAAPDTPAPEAVEETAPESEPEPEDDADPFYAGGTIEWIVTSGPGGGSDTMARFLASWLPECTAGNPDVQVVNIEGAGGVVGTNEFVLRRDPDGFTIVSTGPSSTLNFLLQHPEAQYDLRQMYPVFGIGDEDGIYVAPETGIEAAPDLADPDVPLVMGAQAPQSTDTLLLVAWELLGVGPEVVFGYEGRAETRLAFERGELNVDAQSIGPFRQFVDPMVDAGEAVPIMATGVPEGGDVVRGPGFPDLPTVKEVYEEFHGGEPSGPAWDGYQAVLAGVVGLPRGVWTHGDAPDEAKGALRDAFVCMWDNDEFQVELVDLLGAEPTVGDAIDEAVSGLLNVDDDALDWVIDFLVEEHGAER